MGTPALKTAPTLPSCPDQLQEELERKVQTWEQEFKGPFLVKGQQFMDYVSEQWQLFHLEKEKEKQERVSTELSLLAAAWECPWLLPKNASLEVSLLGPSHCPGLTPSLGSGRQWGWCPLLSRLCEPSPFLAPEVTPGSGFL